MTSAGMSSTAAPTIMLRPRPTAATFSDTSARANCVSFRIRVASCENRSLTISGTERELLGTLIDLPRAICWLSSLESATRRNQQRPPRRTAPAAPCARGQCTWLRDRQDLGCATSRLLVQAEKLPRARTQRLSASALQVHWPPCGQLWPFARPGLHPIVSAVRRCSRPYRWRLLLAFMDSFDRSAT